MIVLVYGDMPSDLTEVTLKLLLHKTSQNTTTSAIISGGGDSTRFLFSCFIFASIAAVPAFRGMRVGLTGTGKVVCSANSGLTADASL